VRVLAKSLQQELEQQQLQKCSALTQITAARVCSLPLPLAVYAACKLS